MTVAPLMLGVTAPAAADVPTAQVPTGTNPGAVAVNPVTNKTYVTNYGSGTVTVIDGATQTTTTVTVGTTPQGVAVNPVTNKTYVANIGSDTVTVIDGANNPTTTTTTVIVGSNPYGVAVNTVTNTIYVTNYSSNTVTVIDGALTPPCPVVIGAIGVKYAELGGCNSCLGKAISTELPAQGGRNTQFEHGDIYWSPTTGAHEITGAIKSTWASLGAETGQLGFPTTDELTTPDTIGRYNHFPGGSIYYTPQTGAHEIYGAIAAAWASQGHEAGPLGYPTTGEFGFLYGRVNLFQHGFIYWNPLTGPISLHW